MQQIFLVSLVHTIKLSSSSNNWEGRKGTSNCVRTISFTTVQQTEGIGLDESSLTSNFYATFTSMWDWFMKSRRVITMKSTLHIRIKHFVWCERLNAAIICWTSLSVPLSCLSLTKVWSCEQCLRQAAQRDTPQTQKRMINVELISHWLSKTMMPEYTEQADIEYMDI